MNDVEEKTKLKKAFKRLYSLGEGILFKEIIDENWALLDFSKQPSLPQFEAFLIDVIIEFT